MIVAIHRRPGRGLGDAVDDILAGSDSDGLVSKPAVSSGSGDSLMVPTWASNASAAPPTNVTQGNNSSSWSWSDLGKTFIAGITQGLTRPLTQPAAVVRPQPSSGISTPVILGVGALVLVGAILVMRRQSA